MTRRFSIHARSSVGNNQAQHAASDAWWRADLQPAAEAAAAPEAFDKRRISLTDPVQIQFSTNAVTC
jgi:hypothetical protein